MRSIFLSGVAIASLCLLVVFNKSHGPALDRVADRVERLKVIPDVTRHELTQLIESVTKDAAPITSRNMAAIARIERAMHIKSVDAKN